MADTKSKETRVINRNSNFELLRIVCMLFIIAGHVIMIKDFETIEYDRFYKCGLRPLFTVAVNCFVLISGWFGIKFAWKKVFRLNNVTTFYTVVIGLLFAHYNVIGGG